MFMLIAKRNGRVVECVPGFTRRSDAEHEAQRLNALPEEWQSTAGQLYHRPYWEVDFQPAKRQPHDRPANRARNSLSQIGERPDGRRIPITPLCR